jgi:hypothetical protein
MINNSTNIKKTNNHIFHVTFVLIFFLYKNIVNMSVSSRLYYYNWVDTCPGGVIPPEGINHPVVSSSTLTRFVLDIFMFEIDSS